MAAERLLIWYLRISALVFMAAAPAVVMPIEWMITMGGWLGLDVPDVPLMQYLTRSVSALYAAVGVACWRLSCDVRRYLPLLRFTVVLTAAVSMIIAALDLWIPMPAAWIVGECVTMLVWTLGLWWLVHRADTDVTNEKT